MGFCLDKDYNKYNIASNSIAHLCVLTGFIESNSLEKFVNIGYNPDPRDDWFRVGAYLDLERKVARFYSDDVMSSFIKVDIPPNSENKICGFVSFGNMGTKIRISTNW